MYVPGKRGPVYRAPFWARNPVTQTFVGRSKVRRWGKNRMLEVEEGEILSLAHGVRLQGFVSRHTGHSAPRPIVILLSGWEGSAHSTYMICLGRYLYSRGFDMARLNFRDHGRTHHLNKGIFHGGHIQEVEDAVKHWTKGSAGSIIVGFSLGGNFALRLASQDLPGVRRVYAVSPILDPYRSTRAIEEHPLFGPYFREKWARSLRRKAELFPDEYNFSDLFQLQSLIAMTDRLVKKHTEFPSARAYFDQYTLTPGALSSLQIPSTIITSLDDPLLPGIDYPAYEIIPKLTLSVQRHGGHMGFVGPLVRTSWYEKVIYEQIRHFRTE